MTYSRAVYFYAPAVGLRFLSAVIATGVTDIARRVVPGKLAGSPSGRPAAVTSGAVMVDLPVPNATAVTARGAKT